MTRAIVLHELGGPEKLEWQSVNVDEPGRGQLRIHHTAIGVNFHDIYVRTGLYKSLPLPGVPGVEAVGIVESVGSGVEDFAPGDRVCYIDESYGAYSETRLLSAAIAVHVPDWIDDEAAASLLLKSFTACMLLRRIRQTGPNDKLLIHAAAGAVGQSLVRWAKHLGAYVIATVGSAKKAVVAHDCGADEVILYREENFVDRVKEMTSGGGLDVVYDSVGADTFMGSLDCLDYFGMLVNFGQSSGPVPPFSVSRLAVRSNSVVRPIVFHYIRERAALEAMAEEAFAVMRAGILKPQVGLQLPLSCASDAHLALESRSLMGSVILSPVSI